ERTRGIPVDLLALTANRADIIDEVAALYRELDAEIAAHSPACWNKGECCRFGEYGHRLFVTTLEVAYYLARPSSDPLTRVSSDRSLPVLGSDALLSLAKDICPHAHDGRWHARDRRPMGCRIFYCDAAAQDWQGPLT